MKKILAVLLVPLLALPSAAADTRQCLCDADAGRYILRSRDFDCNSYCSGGSSSRSSSSSASSPEAQMIDLGVKAVGAFIELFKGFKKSPSSRSSSGRSGSGSYTPPKSYQGERIIRSHSGPSASQQAAAKKLEEQSKKPEWSAEEVARRVAPDQKALDKANGMYESLREATCDMAHGADPYDETVSAIDEVGMPDSAADRTQLAAGSSDWREYAAAWCQPFKMPTNFITVHSTRMGKAAPPTPQPGGGKPLPGKNPGPGDVVDETIKVRALKVEEKKAAVAVVEADLGGRKQLEQELKAAEKKAAPSILDEIIAMRRDNQQAMAANEKKLDAAAKELKGAVNELAGAKSDARKALDSPEKFEKFAAAHPPTEPSPETPEVASAAPGADAAANVTLRLWRPSQDELDFTAEVRKKLGAEGVPFPSAAVKLTCGSEVDRLVADPLGKARFSPREALACLPDGAPRLELKGESGKASHTLTATRQELELYVRTGAKTLADRAEKAYAVKDYPAAVKGFWSSLQWQADEAVAARWAEAVGQLGPGHGSLAAYRLALLKHARDPQRRAALKRQAIAAAKKVTPPPPVTAAAIEAQKKGAAALAAADATAALAHFELASSLAPWWGDPYYAQGQAFQYLAFNEGFHYGAPAVAAYELFLAAAPKDSKAASAKREKADMEELLEAMAR